jgi:hypothetical protein
MPAAPPSVPELPMTDDAKLALLREVASGHLRDDLAKLNARLAQFEALFGSEQNVVNFVASALPQAVQQAHMPRTRTHLDAAMGDPWIGAAGYAAEHKLDQATQALAPIMLPAISQAVKERLAALSKAMERASPARRIQWKIKSLQTGLPLETVMEQDLDPFQVHRLLAVEMPSGSLLATYRVLDEYEVQDPAAHRIEKNEEEAMATAALLTALRGFVRDAGLGAGHAELSSVDLGARSLHIGQQGSLMVAVEASGALAHDLETSMHADLFPALRQAKTQSEREAALAGWRADAVPKVRKTSGSPWKLIVVSSLAILGALFYAKRSIEQTDIERTLNRVRNTPGVAAANLLQGAKTWEIYVAADPLANVELPLSEGLLAREKITLFIDPILSLDATSMARAIERSLPPPPGVQLIVTRAEVRVIGEAPKAYVDALRQHPRVRLGELTVNARISAAPPPVTN